MPIELDTSHNAGARLKVVGVGGAGGNAVRTMISRGLENVEFIAANTDSQALMRNPAQVKIQLGSDTTRGLGAGANPEIGRTAVEESLNDVRDALSGADMVFVTAGMGGGTGTGAAPTIAREARDLGTLVVGIVTKPFSFENKKRSTVAEHGINELRDHVDALIVIPNDRILSVVDASVPFKMALEKADEVLYNATKGIADIILHEGIINVDFADVSTVMRSQGDALMGIGVAAGDRRAMEAAQNALNSPILEGMQIFGAKGLLVNITGGHSLTMHEVNEAISCVQKAAGEEANLIHGVVIEDSMDEEISVTVVATGFRGQPEQVAPPRERTSVVDNLTIVRNAEPPAQPAPEPMPSDDEDEPVYRPAATTSSDILRSHGKVDREDLEQPAIWRRKQQDAPAASEPESAPMPKPIPAATPKVTVRKAAAAAQPVRDERPDDEEPSSGGQPETFLRPAQECGLRWFFQPTRIFTEDHGLTPFLCSSQTIQPLWEGREDEEVLSGHSGRPGCFDIDVLRARQSGCRSSTAVSSDAESGCQRFTV